MALKLDPLYHTETMLRILMDQGSTLYAMELAEKIIEKDPDNTSVREILEDLKARARASFDRFRQGGKKEEERVEKIAPKVPESEQPLAEVQSFKVGKLQRLLRNVQNYRERNA